MQTKRLFFALWPTPEISQAIKGNNQKVTQSISGNFIAQSNWHVTLVFLGNIDTKTINCLVEQAKQIQCPAFEIEFNTVLYFKKAKVLCYGITGNTVAAELNSLVTKCKQIQEYCGLKSEVRDFVPHITVVRKAQQPQAELIIKPIVWQASEFVLVLSENKGQGSEYTVLHRWKLVT